MPQIVNGMYGSFKSVCESCGWTSVYVDHMSAGNKVGEYAHRDPTNAAVGRCNRCKRHKMVVESVPNTKTDPETEGFWKVPEE